MTSSCTGRADLFSDEVSVESTCERDPQVLITVLGEPNVLERVVQAAGVSHGSFIISFMSLWKRKQNR